VAQTPLPNQPHKPALGRGLEDLLGKPAAPETREDVFDPPATDAQPVTLSPGFRTLLHANRKPAPPSEGTTAGESDTEPWLAASLIGADVLFILLAIWQVRAAPPTLWTWILCFLALAMGAWLSILALLSQSK
jgi:hypothetical protein